MTTPTFWLLATTIVAITVVAFLAFLRTGIARQERSTTLTTRPRGLTAALARRILGMHAEPPRPASRPRPRQRERAHSAHSRKAGTP